MSRAAKVIVVGAGIGGLTTAALLAQAGLDVTVLEAATYPGGSAGTFYHKGYRFDAGATVAGGFQPNGPHRLLGEQLKIDWRVRPFDPAWVVHLPHRQITLSRDNAEVIAQFPHSQPFWDEQRAVADLTWALAAEGLPWPPASAAELRHLLRVSLPRLPQLSRLLPLAFGTAGGWMRRHHLAQDAEFVRLIDAQLLISAQTTSQHANALYSATALDLVRQGTYAVEGGMGGIAEALAARLAALGGQVLYRRRVCGIDVRGGRVRGVYVQTGRRASQRTFMPADFVVANLTPGSLDRLLGEASPPPLRRAAADSLQGWGAFALYLGVDAAKLPANLADHHQIVTDMTSPLGEGRSLFISLSPQWDASRAPTGFRAVTVTTHTDVAPWWNLLQTDRDAYEARKADYTERLLSAMDARLPGFRASVALTMPGTPATFANYTGRYLGLVGGFPQTSLVRARSPQTGIPNLRAVGDSIFPGQSTAGVTLGAMRVASDVLRGIAHPLTFASVDARSAV
jgi:C-3',4' desaturase CrtD